MRLCCCHRILTKAQFTRPEPRVSWIECVTVRIAVISRRGLSKQFPHSRRDPCYLWSRTAGVSEESGGNWQFSGRATIRLVNISDCVFARRRFSRRSERLRRAKLGWNDG